MVRRSGAAKPSFKFVTGSESERLPNSSDLPFQSVLRITTIAIEMRTHLPRALQGPGALRPAASSTQAASGLSLPRLGDFLILVCAKARPDRTTDFHGEDMQILTLRVGERVRIGADITVSILQVGAQGVRIKVVAPEARQITQVPAVVQQNRTSGSAEGPFDPVSN